LGGETTVLIVQGTSMLPHILPGSLVVAKEAPPYGVDDIVAYQWKQGSATKNIVHRIIDETDKGFAIQGDNNRKKDPGFYSEDDILGRVIFATPYVGDILALFRNPVVLVLSGVILAAIQMEQKRRKKKKEKLRRIRLGIPQTNNILKQKVQKKPDYTLFFAALAFNVLIFVVIQFSIASGIRPTGDLLTGFLFKILESSFASTIIFALYFIFIFGLYFIAKLYEAKSYKTKTPRKKSKLQLLIGKESNPMLALASFLWILFILMSLFHLMSIAKDLSTVY
jgi:signal peptidase I